MNEVCLLVGKRIRYWRKRKGYTQSELADFCNTSKNNISDIENGKHFPSFELAIRINFCLCVNFKDLYCDALDYIADSNNNKCAELLRDLERQDMINLDYLNFEYFNYRDIM